MGTIRQLKSNNMKKLTLLLIALCFAGVSFGQTLTHTDTLNYGNDLLLLKWSHVEFIDSDQPFKLTSRISLVKELITPDSTFVSSVRTYEKTLREGDSLYNPFDGQYYSYIFVKNYIYTTGEGMKRVLTQLQILNWEERVFE